MTARILCGVGVPLAAAAVIAFGTADKSRGQPPAEAKDTASESAGRKLATEFLIQPDPAKSGGAAFSVVGCRACHVGADTPGAKFFEPYKSAEFVLLNESVTWSEKDVHSIAFQSLESDLGKQMSKVLGYEVSSDARCLTCHSVDLTPFKPLASKVSDDFVTSDGVNCASCHGLGAMWQGPLGHYQTPAQKGKPMPWRAETPASKYAKGMADLRNPAAKALLCVSCHVGNPDEGKVITHEMYAAGHPPLPPFELGTFMEDEPKHWGYPTDDKLKFFETFAKDNPKETWPIFHYHPASEESYLARHVACGAIASLGAEMRTIAAEAKAAADPNGTTLVDYARFDCYACHHDLKYPSPRQERGYAGLPPGRPPLKAWVAALPGIVAEHAKGIPELKDKVGDFTAKWDAVQKAAVARPFGAPVPLDKAATELAAWCDDFLQAQSTIATPLYTKQQSERLADMVAKAAIDWSADTEAAMHLTWAYVTIRSDLEPKLSETNRDQLGQNIPIQVRTSDDYTIKVGDMVRPKPVRDYLKSRLEKFDAYNPDELKKTFEAILKQSGSTQE